MTGNRASECLCFSTRSDRFGPKRFCPVDSRSKASLEQTTCLYNGPIHTLKPQVVGRTKQHPQLPTLMASNTCQTNDPKQIQKERPPPGKNRLKSRSLKGASRVLLGSDPQRTKPPIVDCPMGVTQSGQNTWMQCMVFVTLWSTPLELHGAL